MSIGELAELLISRGISIACAESLTGGLFAELLTGESGISAVFRGGVVCYCNEAKIDVLGVREQTIAAHSEVSAECAAEMAVCAAKRFNADIGVSFTGIAGPTGAMPNRPVGTVFSSIYYQGVSYPLANIFNGTRSEVRSAAVTAVLNALIKIIG